MKDFHKEIQDLKKTMGNSGLGVYTHEEFLNQLKEWRKFSEWKN